MSNNTQKKYLQGTPRMAREESMKKKLAGPDTTMTNSAGKQPTTSTPTQASRLPDFSNLPAPWDQNCQDLWEEGAQTVKKPDGSHDNWEVVNWLLTRKGGAAANWTELEEGQKAIEAMREETLDLNQIREQAELEKETREKKEQRRLANKMRFRPRREWNKAGDVKEGPASDSQGDFGNEGNQTLGPNGDGKSEVQANGEDKHD